MLLIARGWISSTHGTDVGIWVQSVSKETLQEKRSAGCRRSLKCGNTFLNTICIIHNTTNASMYVRVTLYFYMLLL